MASNLYTTTDANLIQVNKAVAVQPDRYTPIFSLFVTPETFTPYGGNIAFTINKADILDLNSIVAEEIRPHLTEARNVNASNTSFVYNPALKGNNYIVDVDQEKLISSLTAVSIRVLNKYNIFLDKEFIGGDDGIIENPNTLTQPSVELTTTEDLLNALHNAVDTIESNIDGTFNPIVLWWGSELSAFLASREAGGFTRNSTLRQAYPTSNFVKIPSNARPDQSDNGFIVVSRSEIQHYQSILPQIPSGGF